MQESDFLRLSSELASAVVTAARDLGVVMATAESCTGGLLASRIVSIPGASAILDCGVITYSNQSKSKLLGIDESDFKQGNAVTAEIAERMAVGLLARADVDLAIAITGELGPCASLPDNMIGLAYIGLTSKKGAIVTKKFISDHNERTCIMHSMVISCLEQLTTYLQNL